MPFIVNTNKPETIDVLDHDRRHWVYNGLDVCITAQIKDNLDAQMDPVARATYQQAIAWQAPLLDMMFNGLKVDISNRERLSKRLRADQARLTQNLNRLIMEGMGFPEPLNPRSPTQVKMLLYSVMKLPAKKKRNTKGTYAASADRETLEALAVQHFYAEPIISHILAIRDLSKALGFLKTPIDDDGCIRCSFNLAGTNTGRLSSQISDFGTGTNLQNISSNLKYMFIPPKGRKFVNIDLEQADARNVGALAWNFFYEEHGPEFAGAFLDATESGDLHTLVCHMAWPELDWPEEREGWRAVAEQVAYRGNSYRQLAKKLGHGTNYLGQPATMAMHTKVKKGMIEAFQHNYFAAFPCVKAWQNETIRRLKETGHLTNLFGRRRMFFGRRTDQPVINAAIAYAPQGSTGEEINHGINALWQHKHGKWFQLHVQVHDSILFSIPEEAEDELVPLALSLMEIHLRLAGGRDFFVPLDAQTGWNYGYAGKGNLSGLTGWKGHDPRTSPYKYRPRPLSFSDAL